MLFRSRIDELIAKAHALSLADAAPKPIVLGRHLIALGLKPGPGFTPIIELAFEAQLDGAFADEPGGLEWVRRHLGQAPAAVSNPRPGSS